MDDYDEDYVIPLTQIEWTRQQKKDLKVGFIFLGLMLLGMASVAYWFFSGR